MNQTQHQRTIMLIGQEAFTTLQTKKVAVCGVGGVGSYVAESLARSGVGSLLLIDNDTISLSNCNRQLPALHSTLGIPKVQVMASRIGDIDPQIQVDPKELFLTAETPASLFEGYDYIVDAVDNVTAKLRLIEIAKELNIPIISAMGCGNKVDPAKLVITDLFKTDTCPLCRVMRRECKVRGIHKLKVVYSTEPPRKPITKEEGRTPPANMIFVPATAGLMIGAEIVKDLIEE